MRRAPFRKIGLNILWKTGNVKHSPPLYRLFGKCCLNEKQRCPRTVRGKPEKVFHIFRFSGSTLFVIINITNRCPVYLCTIWTEREGMKTDRLIGILSVLPAGDLEKPFGS